MILLISVLIMDVKNSPTLLNFYVFMLIFYSYILGNFLGKDKEIETCYREKKMLLESEMTCLKAFNKRTDSLLKDLLYEYKGKRYVLLENVEFKPTTNGSNRDWVEGVAYAPIDDSFKTYVRDKEEFFDRFKKVEQ